MPRRVMGREYLVEPGVAAVLRGFARSTGHAGKKMAHLGVGPGVAHLFTAEHLGPTVGGVRAEWAVGEAGRGGAMMVVADLPAAVRERYRLDGVDFVCVTREAEGYRKAWPTAPW